MTKKVFAEPLVGFDGDVFWHTLPTKWSAKQNVVVSEPASAKAPFGCFSGPLAGQLFDRRLFKYHTIIISN